MTLSSARKSPFSFNNSRRASNALNFPFNFAIPTTRDINLMFLLSRRSLYSRCGSFVIKQIDVVLGSTRGYSIGLDVKKARCQTTNTQRIMPKDIHFDGFDFILERNLLDSNI